MVREGEGEGREEKREERKRGGEVDGWERGGKGTREMGEKGIGGERKRCKGKKGGK